MKKILCLALTAAAMSPAAFASTQPSTDSSSTSIAAPEGSSATTMPATTSTLRPFSRFAFSAGIGVGGINLQAAVNANRYINIRGIGNYFSYSVNNVKIDGSDGSNGVDVSGKLNFAEGGVAMDLYPFPNHGFRLSPGVTFYNQNGASATGVSSAGSSITLGSQKYYSDSADPMSLDAKIALNTHKQAFSMTTGWGNMISRGGGHLSFPFEIGAIFTGAPTIGLNIAGSGCTAQADAADNGPSCVSMTTNASAQQNIASQVTKYQNDVNVLKVYPIFSFGIAYNFKIR
jgi:hypothetical protein